MEQFNLLTPIIGVLSYLVMVILSNLILAYSAKGDKFIMIDKPVICRSRIKDEYYYNYNNTNRK